MPHKIDGTDLWHVPLRHPRLWCGPAAACILTGQDYDKVIRPALNRVTGRASNAGVRGMLAYNLVAALKGMGWTCQFTMPNADRAPTLRRFAEWAAEETDWPVLVHVTGHFVVCQREIVVDNRETNTAAEHWCRRRYVRHAWRVCETVEQYI